MRTVHCLGCGQTFAREDVAALIRRQNPWLDELARRELAPDGDVAVDDVRRMIAPVCSVCGGILKPDVVFFGEFVPPTVFQQATALLGGADALLVAGFFARRQQRHPDA